MSPFLLPLIFVVAALVGYRWLGDVPPLLHTPLMSGMNALSGITIVGALSALAVASQSRWLAAAAVVLAAINVAGGLLVTDRMLRLFKNGGAAAGAREEER